MPDVFTTTKRSQVMSLIKSRGNRTTEASLVSAFRRQRVTGWRRHRPIQLSPCKGNAARRVVTPDFVFIKSQVVVFVDGCFWHCCPKHFRCPQANADWWAEKLAANVSRDRYVNRALRRAGWKVIRFWEHDLNRRADMCAGRVKQHLVTTCQ
jgi:DNA mismatch endonuclease (patch repair protein)